jgi:predicted house-cleaning noncanonical NTP pyrophosphatase (MazG superfamily)
MTMKRHEKLVRDKIPQIIEAAGKNCRYRICDGDEFRDSLFNKLVEEVGELIADPCTEELADIYEVLEAISAEFKLSSAYADQIAKRVTKGAFEHKIILEWVEE